MCLNIRTGRRTCPGVCGFERKISVCMWFNLQGMLFPFKQSSLPPSGLFILYLSGLCHYFHFTPSWKSLMWSLFWKPWVTFMCNLSVCPCCVFIPNCGTGRFLWATVCRNSLLAPCPIFQMPYDTRQFRSTVPLGAQGPSVHEGQERTNASLVSLKKKYRNRGMTSQSPLYFQDSLYV